MIFKRQGLYALLLVTVFLCGYYVGFKIERGNIASNNLSVLSDTVTRLNKSMDDLQRTNAALMRDSAAILQENEDARKAMAIATDDISAFFDRVREQTESGGGSEATNSNDSCSATERENARLRGEVQRTLGFYNESVEVYRREATRADEVTRGFNLCVRTLKAFEAGQDEIQ